jgi:hypothetical protein
MTWIWRVVLIAGLALGIGIYFKRPKAEPVSGLLVEGGGHIDSLEYRHWTNWTPGLPTSVGSTAPKAEPVVVLGYYDKSNYWHVVTGFKEDAFPNLEKAINGGGK